jgi:phosphatidylinositol kinase/protein kinase (PI-3  family)
MMWRAISARSYVAALGPTGTHGSFRLAAECTLGALREGRGVLLGLLEAFVRDPLLVRHARLPLPRHSPCSRPSGFLEFTGIL